MREGNKDNWFDELAHSEREIASIEDKLAILYERRGQIVESMRAPGSDQEQHQMLQERKHCKMNWNLLSKIGLPKC